MPELTRVDLAYEIFWILDKGVMTLEILLRAMDDRTVGEEFGKVVDFLSENDFIENAVNSEKEVNWEDRVKLTTQGQEVFDEWVLYPPWMPIPWLGPENKPITDIRKSIELSKQWNEKLG